MIPRILCSLGLMVIAVSPGPARAGALDRELGRNDVRVWSAAYEVPAGRTVEQTGLPARLESLGYERVRRRPDAPGHYFWGYEVFWVHQREHRRDGRWRSGGLAGMRLRKQDGMILGPLEETGVKSLVLEPELLAESLDGDRARRVPVEFDALPVHVWRAVLAAEDARYFDHGGVDGRSLARALMANVLAGAPVQGGSTITQQLIKNRDLSPKKTLGRKASEALRALALEAEYDKREILEAYLNIIYMGNMNGLAVHGLGTAARVYFSKPVQDLTLTEAALLAGMIQGPNRLTPVRHPERALARRNWVLDRLAELGWAGQETVAQAKRSPLGIEISPPRPFGSAHFTGWVAAATRQAAPRRTERRRGVVVETTLDPHLQRLGGRAVREHLERLRRDHRRLRSADLSAALVAVDATNGAVLAYVGGDPADPDDRFDRVSKARRQPGSTIKPLLLLEAFEDCGVRDPLHPASRVADEPLRVELADGPWEPTNFDGRFRGVVDIREAVRLSLNVPFARIVRWCGEREVTARLRRLGLGIPEDPPPSFALGSIEMTPLELVGAYTVLAARGRAFEPYGLERIERPGGRDLETFKPRRRRVVGAGTAYLVRDLLRDAIDRGTGRAAGIEGLDVAGKTGSTRDAWFVGHAGGIVTAVWVGLDREGDLGLTGGKAAAPLWREFMRQAVPARAPQEVARPDDVVVRRVNPRTGLLTSKGSRRGRDELFRRDALPRRNRFWRRDRPEPVVW